MITKKEFDRQFAIKLQILRKEAGGEYDIRELESKVMTKLISELGGKNANSKKSNAAA